VTKTQNVNFTIEPDFMESFCSFSFGRMKTIAEFVDLFASLNSSEDSEIIRTLQLAIVNISGLKIDQFEILSSALKQLQIILPVFVCSVIDLIICQSITDFKVMITIIVFIYFFRFLILSILNLLSNG
jgi:hypothetical protein